MWAALSGLINNGKLTNQIVNLVAAMVKAVLNNDTCHHSAQNVVESRGTLHISSLITVQTSPNHIKFCFFYYHNIKWYRKYFFRAWAENGIAWHTDASSVVWAARLVAIAVKNTLDAALSQVRENNQHCLLVAIKFKYLLLHFHWLAVTKFCTWCKFVPFLYFFNKSTTNLNKSTGRTDWNNAHSENKKSVIHCLLYLVVCEGTVKLFPHFSVFSCLFNRCLSCSQRTGCCRNGW